MLSNFKRSWLRKLNNRATLSAKRIVDNLPTELLLFQFICGLLIYETDFYRNYYKVLDTIDTILFSIIGITIIYDSIIQKKFNRYSEVNLVSLTMLICILLVQCSYWIFDMTDSNYISLYRAFLTASILAIIICKIEK